MTEDWAASRDSGGPGPTGLVKLTVNLTTEELSQLRFQAKVDHITVTDAIRRSLAIGQIAWEAQHRKARLMIREGNGELRPVEIPSVRSE